MTPGNALREGFDNRLHDQLAELVLDHGPQSLEWLVRRARRELRDVRVDERTVIGAIERSALLLPRPTGEIDRTFALLEGNVLTHRVRASLRGRTDLWLGVGVQPLLDIAAWRPLQLADGSGEVRCAEPEYDALLGPAGWLPDVDRFGLIGLRIVNRRLVVTPVSEDELPSPERQLRLRQMLSSIYTSEWCFNGDDLSARPADLVRTVSVALLEDPEIFATPCPPLDELLHNPMQRDLDVNHWRSVAVSQQCETVGFWLDGMPAGLHIELTARARQYGTTDAQFIVALLGTLAWRTPFAEDLEPWTAWESDHGSRDWGRLR